MDEVKLAKLFHQVYEDLALSFGYKTRSGTKEFDENSKNGKLMIATCKAILPEIKAGQVEPEVKPESGGWWNKVKPYREKNRAIFNKMALQDRQTGATACAIDCLRDLVMMKDDIDKLIEKRIREHFEYVKEQG